MTPTVKFHHAIVTVYFDHFDEHGERVNCLPLTNENGEPFTVYNSDLNVAVNIPLLQAQLNARLAEKSPPAPPALVPDPATNGASESRPTLTPLP